ncbi:hypothetical protein CAPTEDRAFT_221048 [Capitella teleta]|uniref:Apple domain-containing protein n=1 Tax=Capitella teleta TaxID=283909 RepID=R7UDP1_CAPTE|nr:hypothetical protein CAPTEDRAFT_221048 [Capitella teleta]|eukprot:ELU04495.1 hypothetical protein CAPTEDRAFT_221048 [Capitella teleta]
MRDSAHCMRKYGVLKEGNEKDGEETEKSAPWWAVQEPYYAQQGGYGHQQYYYPIQIVTYQPSTMTPEPTTPTPTVAPTASYPVHGYGHVQYHYIHQPYHPYPTATEQEPDTTEPPMTTEPTTVAKPVKVPSYGYGAAGHGHDGGYSAATAFMTPNAHLQNGTYISYVNSLKKCWRACVFSLTCKGFDFNHHYGTCYLHDDDTVCQALVAKEACTNYRLIHCPTTFAPPTPEATTPMIMTTSPTPGTMNQCVEFDQMHIYDGYLQGGISSKDDCIAGCAASAMCVGIDFDSHGNTCWFHSTKTECNAFVAKATSVHCRFQPDTCATNGVLNPMAAIVDAHAKGGVRQPSITDANTCFAMCTGTCIAIDFDMKDNTCWHHTDATCGNLYRAYSVLHLLRTDCPHSTSGYH